MTYNNYDDIKNNIIIILKNKFEISTENIEKYNFFDELISLTPIEMIYLFFILQKTYNIKFDSGNIDDDNFYTLKGLTEIINIKINKM